MISTDKRCAALVDPAYHRYLMFGMADAVRARAMRRDLRPHETQAVLRWPQIKMLKRVERAVADRNGEVIVGRFARQSGKNETEGMLEARALSIWRAIPGSIWVRTAPTYKPQIVISKRRLDKHLKACPLIAGRYNKREGFIVESGGAEVHFLSSGPTANVVGDTASVALSVDEAHKVDQGKFDEDLAPFTANTNAPTILWGVAADKLDLLYEYRCKLDGTDALLEFPAEVWCDLSPAYAGHYEARVKLLGSSHPIIRTQYDLVDIEGTGGYFKPAHRSALFAGDHPRMHAPRDGKRYAILVDIGGESEIEDDAAVIAAEPGRDYTWCWIIERDTEAGVDPYPLDRIVDARWWVGRPHMQVKVGETSVADDILKLAREWGVSSGVIDARGVGEAVAAKVHRTIPGIIAYKATLPDVSEDCYDLLARINTGRLTMWSGNVDTDDEYAEVTAEAMHTRYEIAAHTQMRIVKPTGARSTGLHIDAVKALTYLRQAFASPDAGFDSYVARAAEAVRRAVECAKSGHKLEGGCRDCQEVGDAT